MGRPIGKKINADSEEGGGLANESAWGEVEKQLQNLQQQAIISSLSVHSYIPGEERGGGEREGKGKGKEGKGKEGGGE